MADQQLIQRIKEQAQALLPEMVALRRHLHRHPELSFQEIETTRFLKQKLVEHGFSPCAVPTPTGTMIRIGEAADDQPTLLLRADIDALPIVEENEHDYVSQNPGVMHACGHDVHTTCLLGAARILQNLDGGYLQTPLKLVFQPAEEKSPGGAKPMIEGGILDHPPVGVALGQHVAPDLPAGTVGFRPGLYMASTDELYLEVHGVGGHAAMPDRLIDPVVIAAHLISQLQTLVSRQAPPHIPTVLSFGRVEALGANNVIPNKVSLAGTLRTFDEDWRAEAKERLERLVHGIVEAQGGKATLEIREGYPALRNDETVTRRCRRNAVDYLGEDKVIDLEMRPTGEDFAYFSLARPSTFYRLGTRRGGEAPRHLHTSRFDIDEEALAVGAGLLAYQALSTPPSLS
jgi:amidohydrolase